MHELYLEKPGSLTLKESSQVVQLQEHEARIKTAYGGICGSDLRVFHGTLPYAHYPCRPGHEIVGTIIEAGESSPYQRGERVISYPNTYCGSCDFCLDGKTNVCAEKQSFGVTINGLFGEEVVVDSEFLVPVPPGLAEQRAILTEPLAVNVHALKKADIKAGTRVAVVGCGTEGLLSTALLDYMDAEVTVIDINPAKMEKAKRIYPSINTLDPGAAQGQLFEVVIEAAGVKAAIEQAFTLVKPGGTMIALGITNDEVRYPALHVTRSEMTIHGSIIYTKQDFQDAFEYLNDPGFNIAPVISKVLPFDQYEQAYAAASTGEYTKILLDFQKG